MSDRRWPELLEEDRWLIPALEERLRGSSRTPDQLRARAVELRAEAAACEVPAVRETTLMLADRFDEAAAGRSADGSVVRR